MKIPALKSLKEYSHELRSEKFEWFGPSPIEPFNLGLVQGLARRAFPGCPRLDALLTATGQKKKCHSDFFDGQLRQHKKQDFQICYFVSFELISNELEIPFNSIRVSMMTS